MKKHILWFLALLTLAAPALATEHVGGLANLTLPAGATYSAGAIHVSNVWGSRIYKTDATILPGHTYQYSVTIANYTGSGKVVAYSNGTKMSCAGGANWVNSPNGYHGEFDIPDNFDTNAGISPLTTEFPDPPFANHIDNRETDANGSFRYIVQVGQSKFLNDDPMVCPGVPGASHLHMNWGNLGWNAFSTYKSLRTTGGTSMGDSRYPLQRSAIWQPAMLDGAGHALIPVSNLEYYKTIPQSFAECLPPTTDPATYTSADTTHVGICIPLPNGLRWLAGCNMTKLMAGTTPNNCLNDQLITTSKGTYNVRFNFGCYDGLREAGPEGDLRYASLDAAQASGYCTVGRYLYYSLEAQSCWDGTHLDSPDHQSHMAYAPTSIPLSEGGTVNTPGGLQPSSSVGDTIAAGVNWNKCPPDHPYQIPGFSIQEIFKIDANFPHWHLACDENMNMSFPRGTCGHSDYWEAWSPVAKSDWQAGCINGRNSGNVGSLCNGYQINFMKGFTPAASGFDPHNSSFGLQDFGSQQAAFRNRIGYGRELGSNGTFVGELKPQSGGELGLEVYGGFTGDITAFTVTDVTNVGKHSGVNATTP